MVTKKTIKKKDEVAIVSTKVTLNLKGKRVDLTLQELRQLSHIINNTLNGYVVPISSPWFSVTDRVAINNTATGLDTVFGNTCDINPCSEVSLGSTITIDKGE
jgi:hypothetical protein